MENSIKNLWITYDGLLLYEHVKESDIDSDLISSFLSVIDIFIENSTINEKLSIIKLGNRNIYFERDGRIQFIVSTEKGVDDNLIKVELDSLVEKFYMLFDKTAISNWMGNQACFKGYKKSIAVVST